MTLHQSTISLRREPAGSEDAGIRQGIRCDMGRALSLFLALAEWLALQKYIPSGVLHLALPLDLEDAETDYQDAAAAHHLIPGGRPTPETSFGVGHLHHISQSCRSGMICLKKW